MSQDKIIHCQQLSYAYADKLALDQVSFDLSAGEPIGLVGPNGAGKTTLMSLLCGFLPIKSGTISVFGHTPGASKLSGRVAALPQDARLDPNFTIGQQLCFYARLQGFTAQQAMIEAGRVLALVDLAASFKNKPDSLSHGMAKRVAIAQALIGNPELILLDEPTAGLDPVNTRNIRSIISELSPKTTFIISSHDLNELGRLCQQVLLLEHGVMKSMQLNDAETQGATRFITIQMEACIASEVMQIFKQLTGVIGVTNPQKNEFIVEYNPNEESKIDLQLMTCISENDWQYKQMSRGKTLEEQLFFEK